MPAGIAIGRVVSWASATVAGARLGRRLLVPTRAFMNRASILGREGTIAVVALPFLFLRFPFDTSPVVRCKLIEIEELLPTAAYARER